METGRSWTQRTHSCCSRSGAAGRSVSKCIYTALWPVTSAECMAPSLSRGLGSAGVGSWARGFLKAPQPFGAPMSLHYGSLGQGWQTL